MSDKTLQDVHDAIAAHIADENDGSPEYLTEWIFVAAAAISDDPERTSYYRGAPSSPYHHQIGLMERGLEMLRGAED
jgi:hypothetical protein